MTPYPHHPASDDQRLSHPDARLFQQEDEELLLCSALNRTTGEAPFVHRLLGLVTPGDFYLPEHQHIWMLLAALRDTGKSMDPLSIAEGAARRDLPIGDQGYVASLFTSPIYRSMPEASVLEAAHRVRNTSMMRQARDAFVKLYQAAQANAAPVELVLQAASDEIANILRQAGTSHDAMKPIIDPMIRAAEKIIDRQGTDAEADIGAGVRTLYPSLDRHLVCLDGLVYIGARPGMGKTALLMNLGHNAAKQGRPTAVFSLEMPDENVATRYLASRSGVSLQRLRAENNLDPGEQELLLGAVHQAHEFPLYIDDTPSQTLPVLRSRIRDFAKRYPRAVILVDYLQLIKPPEDYRGEGNWVSICSAALRDLQRELGIPIIALSQLNRGLEQRADRRPIMADLRDSGTLEQDASIILFIYRDEVYHPDSADAGLAEIIVGKARDGGHGVVARLRFRGEVQQFEEVSMGAYD